MDYDYRTIRNRKIRVILWLVFSILFIVPFLILIFLLDSWSVGILMGIGLFGLIIVSFLASKFYYWPVLSFFIVFGGLFFKRQHWPLAGMFITVGTLWLGIISLYNSVRFLITFRNNPFLKWIGCITGVIVVLFMTGLLFGTQHWGGFIRESFGYTGSMLFVILVLAIVFTLPNSNFIAWSEIERHVFFKAILFPMIFIFALIALTYLFPQTYNEIMRRSAIYIPWKDDVIQLLNLEGIPNF